MSMNTEASDEQTTLSMKKQLLGELWNEVRRAVDAVNVIRGENESLRQNLAKSAAEVDKLKSRIAELEKMLTAREATNASAFEEREKNRLLEVAKELIARIDKQLSLF